MLPSVLLVCIASGIQLTSSQSTYYVTQRDSDVSSCAGTEQVLQQLVEDVAEMKAKLQRLLAEDASVQVART